MRFPALARILGVTIRAEIGAIERFPDPAHLASYAGLVPRVAGTGGRVRYGAITKRGSAWLRWALVEAAIHGTRRRDAVGRWGRQLAGETWRAEGARGARARVVYGDLSDVAAGLTPLGGDPREGHDHRVVHS